MDQTITVNKYWRLELIQILQNSPDFCITRSVNIIEISVAESYFGGKQWSEAMR